MLPLSRFASLSTLPPMTRRLIKCALVLIIALAVVVSLLPLVLKSGTIYALNRLGIHTEITDITLNLFKGHFGIDGLTASNTDGRGIQLQKLTIDIAVLPLLRRQIDIKSVYMQGLQLDVKHTANSLEIGGILLPAPATDTTAATATAATPAPAPAIDFTIADFTIENSGSCIQSTAMDAFCTQLKSLQLSGQGKIEKNLTLTLDKVNLDNFSLNNQHTQQQALALHNINLANLVVAEGKANLESLSLSGFETALKQTGGNWILNDIRLPDSAAATTTAPAEATEATEATASMPLQSVAIRNISLNDINSCIKFETGKPFCSKLDALRSAITLKLDSSISANVPNFNLRKLIISEALTATNKDKISPLFSLDTFTANNINYDDEHISTQVISVESLTMISRSDEQWPQHMQLAQAQLASLHLKHNAKSTSASAAQLTPALAAPLTPPKKPDSNAAIQSSIEIAATNAATANNDPNLDLGAISVDGLQVLLHRTREGQWQAINELADYIPILKSQVEITTETQTSVVQAQAGKTKSPQTETAATITIATTPTATSIATTPTATTATVTTATPLRFRLASIVMHNGLVLLMDELKRSTQRISALELTIGEINSERTTTDTPVTASATIGEFGRITIDGNLQPLGAALNGNFTVVVDGFNLVSVSPYIEPALGNRIKQGILNHTMTATLNNDYLKISNKLILDKLKLESLNKEEKELAGAEETLPIDVALDLLRDSDNRIKLSLPVTGHTSDPSLSINGVIGVVLRKALTQAVISYYTPFGMFTLTKGVVNSITKLRFTPIAYAFGSNELDSTATDQLNKLATLLQQREQLSLVFCPSIGREEYLALWPQEAATEDNAKPPVPDADQLKQLLTLAQQRSRTIKQNLLDQGVSAKQVVECNPAWKAKSKATVEIYL